MRLLKTRTFKLEEFHGDVPNYAILSHKWEDKEVTYRDFELGRATSRKGYARIQACCKLAALRGIDYVWIDTCCINESSSAELTESTNSMYAWYEEAEECYAFLCGVHVADLKSDESCLRFQSSTWFARGWTLQELIAPTDVLFYNSQWKCLSRKTEIDQLLEKITFNRRKYPF